MGTPPGVEVAAPWGVPWGVPWGMPGGESGVGGGARMGPGPCGGGEEAAAGEVASLSAEGVRGRHGASRP